MSKSILLFISVFGLMFSNIGNINAQDEEVKEDGFQFDTIANVKTSPVKSQFKSGTCWSYATVSYIETEILRIDGVEYDLSEMFYVNYAYRTKAISYIRLHGVANFSPGGQAHDVMDVVRDYGISTEKNYPGKINGYDKDVHGELNSGLAGFLKAVSKKDDKYLSQNWFSGFEALLNSYMGTPPAADVQSKFNVDDYVELTSYMYKPFYAPIRLEVPDNWSFDANYYNLPIDELMEIMNYALKNDYSVCWDGDVSSPGFSHKNALAILPETHVENMQGSEQSKWENMSKAEMNKNMFSFQNPVPEKVVNDSMRQLDFDLQRATDDHLMHLTALLKDQNGTIYYLTKNSWADNSNDNGGYLNMSESYVRLNTIAIMVHKNAIPKSIRKKLKL
ncbi:MAG: aminopeptidase [Bacteroidales bacterium]|nr:aminopeptidase [Bacteroidales bacterium]